MILAAELVGWIERIQSVYGKVAADG